jgi:hypothetical protein
MSDTLADPGPWFYNVLAQGEYDRPLYETTVTLSGVDKHTGFREAIAFGQQRLKDAGYTDPPVRRWIVTHFVPKGSG